MTLYREYTRATGTYPLRFFNVPEVEQVTVSAALPAEKRGAPAIHALLRCDCPGREPLQIAIVKLEWEERSETTSQFLRSESR